MKAKSLSRVRLFVTPFIVAYQAPPSVGFFRQEYWSSHFLLQRSRQPRGQTGVTFIPGRHFNLWAIREVAIKQKYIYIYIFFFLLELSCVFYDPMDVGNLISGSSAFSKSSLNIWKFSVHICWSLAWKILIIALLVCEMSAILQYFEHSLALPFFEIGMKTDLFQSCGHCWVFQICWHIECSTLAVSSFRNWNSSAGI